VGFNKTTKDLSQDFWGCRQESNWAPPTTDEKRYRLSHLSRHKPWKWRRLLTTSAYKPEDHKASHQSIWLFA